MDLRHKEDQYQHSHPGLMQDSGTARQPYNAESPRHRARSDPIRAMIADKIIFQLRMFAIQVQIAAANCKLVDTPNSLPSTLSKGSTTSTIMKAISIIVMALATHTVAMPTGKSLGFSRCIPLTLTLSA
jgi:hypothetical protein